MKGRLKVLFALLAILTAIFGISATYSRATEDKLYLYAAVKCETPSYYYKLNEIGIVEIKDHNETLEVYSTNKTLQSFEPAFNWNGAFYRISQLNMLWTPPGLRQSEIIGSASLGFCWLGGIVVYLRKRQGDEGSARKPYRL